MTKDTEDPLPYEGWQDSFISWFVSRMVLTVRKKREEEEKVNIKVEKSELI